MSADMDSGQHLVLAVEEGEARALRWAARLVRAVFLLAGLVLLFLGALLGAGVLMHGLRGPHQHHPCATETRETCM